MMFEDKVTKKCDLGHNDSISIFNGWGAQQNYNSFKVFYDFINDVKPKRILEIGTSLGGFTCFLKYTTNKLNINCDILTFDIYEQHWYSELINMGIDVRIKNVFSNNYNEVNQEIIDFIQSEGVTIVLCDGGNKVGEFNILSKYIKSGDFILAHDYAENKKTFNDRINGKIWNWHEIQDSDIETACVINNLHSYKKEIFDNIVWVCKIKK
jgi:hypothetical protein